MGVDGDVGHTVARASALWGLVLVLAACGTATTGRVSSSPAPTPSFGIAPDTSARSQVSPTLRAQDVLVSLDDVPADVEDRLETGHDRFLGARLATRACTALAQSIVGQYVVASASSSDPEDAVGDVTAESRQLFPHRPEIVDAFTRIGRRYGKEAFLRMRQLDLPAGTPPAEMLATALRTAAPTYAAVATDCAGDAPRWTGPRATATPVRPPG